ncbi:hypothetical protein [Rhodoferax sp. PAMC 29310]|uniref:hypothetical protein n=1 Tax=Rhodoferax sp. PAMC 29310 TaxID=2822760 RepID=UPI001B336AB2|nr:hypothetical protein [Rhodoferax sp. PAMC 29310]
MKKIEYLELDAHRAQISSDVQQLVEKCRSIFEWDVPDANQALLGQADSRGDTSCHRRSRASAAGICADLKIS